MGRGKSWTPQMDQILIKYYAEEETTKLAKQFGYGIRTVERHAVQLGLKKSEGFIYRIAKKGSDAAKAWIKRKKEKGEPIKKSPGGKPFEKGHKWDEETEKKRIDAIKGKPKKKNLENCEAMSKFAVRKMRTDELEALLKTEMDRVFAIRQELDRRKSEKVESEMAKSVNFEEYVTR